MVKPVHERISVSIKDRVFKLCWDADLNDLSACQRCALLGEICKGTKDMSLLCLCATIVEEPNTFFVESSDRIIVRGINNQEIVTTALAKLRDEEKERGNHSRAKVAQKLIEQI